MTPAYILVDGPHSSLDRDGDECGLYSVSFMDADGEEISTRYFSERGIALSQGAALARLRRVQLVNESVEG